MPNDPQTQKSEVHATTADASTAPTAGQDQQTTHDTPAARPPGSTDTTQRVAPVPPTDVRIIRDDTDDAGPLVIQSTDPDLNPPRAPIDPFPTDRKPEIDP